MAFKKEFNSSIEAGSRKQSHEPRRLSEVLDEYFASNEPLARAYRDHLFPNTEPCCQLKLLTREPGRMPVGAYINGVIAHDKEDRYVFTETPLQAARRRNPMVYKGYCINVTRRPDGSLQPHFRLPQYTRFYTFRDFCREAAEELLMMAGLGEEE